MSKKEYCYISPEGNILKDEDGLSAKAEKEAEELFSEIRNIRKENKDDNKEAEDVKDMIIDAFKEGPLKWKFETNKCNKTSCSIRSNSILTHSTTEVNGDLTTHCEVVKQREGEIKAIAAGKADLSFAGNQLAAANYAAKVEGHGKVSYTGMHEECSKEQTNRKQIVLSASGDVKATGCASAEISVSKYKVKVKGEAEAEAKGSANFLGLETRRFNNTNESGVQVKVMNAQTQGEVSIKSKASVDLQYGDKNKKVQGEFEGRASGSASLKVLDATVSRSNDEIKAKAQVLHAEAKAEADFKAKLTAGESNLEADGKAKAEANFKLLNGKMLLKVKKKDVRVRIPGVKVELAKGKAECTAELNLKNGSDKKNFSAVAKLEMKGAKINALKFDARKKRDYGNKVYAKAEATGFEANIATATITGKKEGSEAGVRAELTGMKVNAVNAQVTGIDDRTKRTSTLNVNTSVDVGNINVQGLGYKGDCSEANVSMGVECFNISIGLKRSTGRTVSTKLSFFNLNLTVGPPSLNFGFGSFFNFGIPFLSGGGDGGGNGGKVGNDNGNKEGGKSSVESEGGRIGEAEVSADCNSRGNDQDGETEMGGSIGVISDNLDVGCGVSSEEGSPSSNFSENYYSDGFDDNDSDDDLNLDENENSNADREDNTEKMNTGEQKNNKANFMTKNDSTTESVRNIECFKSDSVTSGCIVSYDSEDGCGKKIGDIDRKRSAPETSPCRCRADSLIEISAAGEGKRVVSSPSPNMTPTHNDIDRFNPEESEDNIKDASCRDLCGHVLNNYSIDSDGRVVQSEDDCLIVIEDPSPEAVEGIADFFEATELPNNNSANMATANQQKSSTFSTKISECTYGYQSYTTALTPKSYLSKGDTRPKVVRRTNMCDNFKHRAGNKPKNREPLQKSDIRRRQSCKKAVDENSVSTHSDVTVLEQNHASNDMQTYSSDSHDTKDVKANQAQKLNLRDASGYNRHLCEIMANKLKSELRSIEGNDTSQQDERTYDLTEQKYDWTDTKRVKEDLVKASRSLKFTKRDRMQRRNRSVTKAATEHNNFTTTNEASGGMENQQRKPKKKNTPQKPFGEKKNIHTIFTIGAGDTRPIKYLKDNVACFANDE